MTMNQPMNRRLRTGTLITALSAMALVGAQQAVAASIDWDGSGDGTTWDTTNTNWATVDPTPWDGINGPNNDANLGTGAFTANVSDSVSAGNVFVGTAGEDGVNGTPGNSGVAGSVAVSGQTLAVGTTLKLGANGGASAPAGLDAGGAGGAGTMTVSGGGSVTTDTLQLGGNGGDGQGGISGDGSDGIGGNGGNGTLNISNGSVTAANVTLGGILGANVNGFSYPGLAGTGTVNLGAGGSLTVSGDLTINNTVDDAYGGEPGSSSVLNIGWDGSANTAAGTLAVTGNIINNSSGSFIGGVNFLQTDEFTLNKVISGSGAVAQNGPGTTIIESNNTYQGSTYVTDGTLLVNGSINSNANISVGGGVLGGTGTIAGVNFDSQSGSQITGGTLGTIGTLTIQTTATTLLGGTYVVDVDYTANAGLGDGDLLSLSNTGGGISLTDGFNPLEFEFNDINNSPPPAGTHYAIKILESDVAIAGYGGGGQQNYTGLTNLASYQSIVTWDGGYTFYLVPEPASFALLGLGSLLLLRRPTRRRKQALAAA